MAKRSIIPLFIPHAGCPSDCVFCNQRKITGQDTPVTPEAVASQVRAALPQAEPDCELAFYGGSFTAMSPATQEALLGAAQPFLSRGEIGSIRLSTRPDAVDGETVSRLLRYGVKTVELGCQSMDDRVLKLSRRGHTAADTVRAAGYLRDAGISFVLQMMTGLPGDDGTASRETAKRIIALRPQGVRIYPTVVLRGTLLERWMREGRYTPQSVEAAVELCAALYEEFLAAGIPVIRVGLNPTEALSDGEAVGGAYDPALGERVLSRIYLHRAEALLTGRQLAAPVVLSVHPRRISVMVGQRRENLLALQRRFSLPRVRVVGEEADLWGLQVR